MKLPAAIVATSLCTVASAMPIGLRMAVWGLEDETPAEPITSWQVAFDANGGMIDGWEAIRYAEIEDGVTFADAIGELPTPEWLGYNFTGWFTAKEGGTQVYDTATANGNATYYAHWDENGEGCVVNGVRWFYRDCDELGGVEIIGIDKINIPKNLVVPPELAGKKVVSIGKYAFSPRYSFPEYDNITNVVFNGELKRLSHGAFEACSNLKVVTIPHSVETIYGFVFYECESLEAVEIEIGVGELYECCFAGCKALHEIELPNSITNIERAIFQECFTLTNVIVNCAKPSLTFSEDSEWDDILWQVPKETTTFYIRNVCGWKDGNGDLPATWLGRIIVYDPIPNIGDEPTAEDIAEILDDSTDERLTAHITDKNDYHVFRSWVNRFCGSDFSKRQAVKDSIHAWLSFALDVDALIVNAPKQGDLNIDKFKPSATSGAFDFEISIENISIGEGATAANLAEIFGIEGSNTPNGAYSSDAVELSFGKPSEGKVRCTARPKGTTKTSFFMKVRMTP